MVETGHESDNPYKALLAIALAELNTIEAKYEDSRGEVFRARTRILRKAAELGVQVPNVRG